MAGTGIGCQYLGTLTEAGSDVEMMEGLLWYVLTGTRGGENRTRLLRALDEQPRNPNQLAEDLNIDYTTVRHHLVVLTDHGIVEQHGEGYGAVYLPTDQVKHHWDTVEEIIESLD